MSTKKDLVEAHSFNRRRLITAFVSGAPGGREVEPVRTGRTLVGGVVLAGLMVGGAAVTGLFADRTPEDWLDPGMVIGDESGSRFVALEGQLYPVINTTSARLLVDAASFEVRFVPDADIAGEDVQRAVGIVGAPDVLPAPADLVQSGWASCAQVGTADVRTTVDTESALTPSVDTGAVVTAGDGVHLISGSMRYAVPDGQTGVAVLRELGLPPDPFEVSADWLNLFPAGPDLVPESFFSLDVGDPPDPSVVGDLPASVRIGDVVAEGERRYIYTRTLVDGGVDEGLAELNPFADAVYRGLFGTDEVPVSAEEIRATPSARAPWSSTWPTAALAPYGAETLCAHLETKEGTPAVVSLASVKEGREEAMVPSLGERSVQVASGHGALVRGYGEAAVDAGQIHLIDSGGTRYPIGQPTPDQDLERLGYAAEPVASVPTAWMRLFPEGPVLSSESAQVPLDEQGTS